MYPFFRSSYEILRARRAPRLGLFDTHVSHHRCWPWDIDPWMELNNGRTLTLYDLGRLPLYVRNGLDDVVRRSGFYFTVAGVSVRYRARIRPFAPLEMRNRFLGWDARFCYVDQTLWIHGECANQALVRSAIAKRGEGIVAPS